MRAAVRKAAKLAVYDEINIRQKKYQREASVRVDTALQYQLSAANRSRKINGLNGIRLQILTENVIIVVLVDVLAVVIVVVVVTLTEAQDRSLAA